MANYTGDVIFVRHFFIGGKWLIEVLREYKITSIDLKTYNYLIRKKILKIDYYIHGPVLEFLLCTPINTRILLMSEYSDNFPFYNVLRLKKLLARRVSTLQTGFLSADFSYKNKGILFTDSLIKMVKLKEINIREYYRQIHISWQELPKNIIETLLGGLSIEDYYSTTELSVEYSHNSENNKLLYHLNSHLHYLRVHQLYIQYSIKNQDVISMGGDIKNKRNALEFMIPILAKNGFSKIFYVDLDNEKMESVYNDNRDGKSYRLIHVDKITHMKMIELQKISSDLSGVTGDQSFSEALSASKLIVYNCMVWKKELVQQYIEIVSSIAQDDKVTELAMLLLVSNDEKQYARLGELLNDNIIINKLKNSASEIYKAYNLNNIISKKVMNELELARIGIVEDYILLALFWLKTKYKHLKALCNNNFFLTLKRALEWACRPKS